MAIEIDDVRFSLLPNVDEGGGCSWGGGEGVSLRDLCENLLRSQDALRPRPDEEDRA